jgi:hypothetical protein
LVAAGDRILVRAMGTIFNNSGASVTYTQRLKIGATTVATSPANTLSSANNRMSWMVDMEIAIESSTAQRIMALSLRNGTAGSGWRAISTAAPFFNLLYNTASENTATDKAIVLSIAMGTASASADCVLEAASLIHARKP